MEDRLNSKTDVTMEEVELLRRPSSDEDLESSDGRAEQGDALLQSSGDDKPKQEQTYFKGSSRFTRHQLRSFGFVALLVLILLYLVYYVAQNGPCIYDTGADSCTLKPASTEVTPVKPTSFRRSQSDYILDPKWDFAAKPKTRKYHFTITDEEINPDGVFREMILINGQFPGPMIECNEGDRLVIEVENQSINATSFHWHGIFQNGSNWMDGTVGVTQCPIAPSKKFTYDFTIKEQHGTYW